MGRRQWAMGHRDMGHIGNGVQGYEACGQWGTWVWGTVGTVGN